MPLKFSKLDTRLSLLELTVSIINSILLTCFFYMYIYAVVALYDDLFVLKAKYELVIQTA